LTAFSQKDTLKISKRAAIGAIKDILKKDELEIEVNSLTKNISIYQDNLKFKDSIILSKNNEINLYKIKDTMSQKIIDLTNEQKNRLYNSVDDLNAQLKKEKQKVIIRTIGGVVLSLLVYIIAK
jgi:hypothetical protein